MTSPNINPNSGGVSFFRSWLRQNPYLEDRITDGRITFFARHDRLLAIHYKPTTIIKASFVFDPNVLRDFTPDEQVVTDKGEVDWTLNNSDNTEEVVNHKEELRWILNLSRTSIAGPHEGKNDFGSILAAVVYVDLNPDD